MDSNMTFRIDSEVKAQMAVAAIAGLFATHKFLYAKSFGTEEKEEKQDK